MLTFVILSYNHPVITARCVSSALKFVPISQIVLLHNGSTPAHVAELKTQFPQLRHWILENNLGYTGGVNEAFRLGFETSEWIFLLTNDTQLTHWNLDTTNLVEGFYAPKIWLRKEGRIDSCGGLFDSRSAKLTHLKQPMNVEKLSWGQYLYIPGTAFLLSRKVYKKLGCMDESLHTYWEDVDFGARATKQNIFMGFLPGVEIIHQGRKTTGKNPFYTNFLFQRNRFIISWRYCPVLWRWRLLPFVGNFLYLLWSSAIFRREIKNQSGTERFDRYRH